jgi:hypothetical protein
MASAAQVHNGLSRHASCHQVTADMASGHDAPDAAPTQSNTSITLDETCSDKCCWWRVSCGPEHNTARKSLRESPLPPFPQYSAAARHYCRLLFFREVCCLRQGTTSPVWDLGRRDWWQMRPLRSALHCRSAYHFS